MKQPASILVTDFDGTMTSHDFYRLALARLLPPDVPDFWDDYLAGRLTHFEALQRIFTHIRGQECAVMAVVRAMELDPQAGQAVRRLHAAGWHVRVASAGCLWYINRLLAEQQIQVAVHGNPGVYDPEQGLRMSLPIDSPYFIPTTGIDKLAVVRDALQRSAIVAFAGDGPPDLPPALLVPPARRFARGYLAAALRERGEAFQKFARWSEIAARLLG